MANHPTPRGRIRPVRSQPLPTISQAALDQVTGGKFSPRTTLDPVLLQGMEKLSQAVASVGQNLAAAKQYGSQQLMQLMQQVMQSRH